ncbi:MAG TPA: hypothetical protein VET65_02065 [Candidatus Limnocylindrales bacterium]|nr:hypothetical protein [Candidatus Limnocylindrales bacterium]
MTTPGPATIPPARRRLLRWIALAPPALIVGALLGVLAYQLARPLPAVAPVVVAATAQPLGAPFAVPWPQSGEATLLVPGLGSMGSSGAVRSIPMASTAKVMTALIVLEDHPLAPGQPGASLTVGPQDVAAYRRDVALDESSVPVTAGESLTELQLLEGLLIPSASNFADLLARWDAGSVDAFIAKMNQRASQLGLTHTHYADASGFSPLTVSIPQDLVEVARRAMMQPVFAGIVSMPSATLPVAGTVRSTDALLSEGLVVGIKTGHTNQAGGNFVFAADMVVDGGLPVRVFGAVMGQPSLNAAFDATRTLVRTVTPHLHYRIVVHKLDPLATYTAPWQARATARASDFLQFLYADGMTLQRGIEVRPITPPTPDETAIGTLSVTVGEQRRQLPVVLGQPLAGPGLRWRLTRSLAQPSAGG